MLLTLDVGNTNITLGVYAGDTLRFVSRMATNPPRMEDQYAADLLAILKLYGVEPEEITGAIMSSVVPGLTAPLTRAVRRVRNVEPLIVSTETVPDLKVRRDMPNTLGADLIVGSHPHVVQPFETDSSHVVLYSLGNLVSNQRRRYTDGGLVARIEALRYPDGRRSYRLEPLPVWVALPRYRILPPEAADTAALPDAYALFRRDLRELTGKDL